MYPKTYARLISITRRSPEWPYYTTNPIYEFRVLSPTRHGNGEILTFEETDDKILAESPRYSGKSRWYETGELKEYKWYDRKLKKYISVMHKVRSNSEIGQIFKLYQRPQDAGRWSYRWLGR